MQKSNTSTGELSKLVKNKNFLNHQNYVFGKILYKRTFLSMSSESNGQNIIGYDKSLKIQQIPVSIIEKDARGGFLIQLFIGLLFTGVGGILLYEKGGMLGFVIMSMGILVLYLFFVYQESSSHQFFRNNKYVIIQYKYRI